MRKKTQDQSDLQVLHWVRSRLVSRRTATINQMRAFLIEQEIMVRTGAHTSHTGQWDVARRRSHGPQDHRQSLEKKPVLKLVVATKTGLSKNRISQRSPSGFFAVAIKPES